MTTNNTMPTMVNLVAGINGERGLCVLTYKLNDRESILRGKFHLLMMGADFIDVYEV